MGRLPTLFTRKARFFSDSDSSYWNSLCTFPTCGCGRRSTRTTCVPQLHSPARATEDNYHPHQFEKPPAAPQPKTQSAPPRAPERGQESKKPDNEKERKQAA